MIAATLNDLETAVQWREDTPGHMLPADVRQVVGVTAKLLGLNALAKGVAIDLGNGYVLVCTTRQAEPSEVAP